MHLSTNLRQNKKYETNLKSCTEAAVA